jgi:hypothetical protein
MYGWNKSELYPFCLTDSLAYESCLKKAIKWTGNEKD